MQAFYGSEEEQEIIRSAKKHEDFEPLWEMYSRNPKRYGARIGRYRVLKVLKKTGIHLTPQAQAEIDGAETSEELNLAILGLDLTPPDIKKGSLDAIKFQIMAKLTGLLERVN